MLTIIKPNVSHIPSYLEALHRGFHDLPIGTLHIDIQKKIEEIKNTPDDFLNLFDDSDARALPYLLPDQTVAYAVPSKRRWIWHEHYKYCGSISLRWQNNTTDLPPHLLGHIGYVVAPWVWNLGLATNALKEMLKLAKEIGLPFVQIVTNLDNLPSQRVVIKNGGILISQFTKPAMYGPKPALRYQINLDC